MATILQGLISMHATEFPWVSDQRLFESLTRVEKRPNLLVLCAGIEPAAVVASLKSWCTGPCLVCRLPGSLRLPAVERGTLLLENVTSMTLGQQIALNDWLAATSGAMQIVSVATESVWAAVEAGEFLESLFYRLNTIVLAATPPDERGRGRLVE
jgi:transcriptional regulator of acetoin/glycerol metabolism